MLLIGLYIQAMYLHLMCPYSVNTIFIACNLKNRRLREILNLSNLVSSSRILKPNIIAFSRCHWDMRGKTSCDIYKPRKYD